MKLKKIKEIKIKKMMKKSRRNDEETVMESREIR